MAIIKDYKNIECLGQFDDVVVYIKKAENRFFDGKIDTVVTAIHFKDLEGGTLYKYEAYNYICLLNDNNRFFNLNSFIDDLALYVSKCNIDSYFKNKTIESALNNEFRGLHNIKVFKKEYYEELENKLKAEKVAECAIKIELIKKDIENAIGRIEASSKEDIRIIKPSKYNDYCYELYTRNTYKKLETLHIWNNVEGIGEYKKILEFFSDYLYYISIDYDPIEFLVFDKVV